MRAPMNILFYLFAIPVGAFAVVAGEADDSPGLQGLGLILLVYVSYRFISQLRKSKKTST